MTCEICGTRAYSNRCYRHKPRKLIRPIGKQGRKTANAVAKWKRKQKPNHQGFFVCYLCKKWVRYLEAEHMKSKARHPELRAAESNFAPVCDECNEKKRSKDADT